MQSKERQELRELRDRIVRLETLIEVEFKNLREQLQETCSHINKLNEEYGTLIKRQNDLELKQTRVEDAYKRDIFYWKVFTPIIVSLITTIAIFAFHYFLGI